MDPIKGWMQSKTVWFNGLAGVLALLSQFTELFPQVPETEVMVALIAAGNMILRFVTSEGVQLTKPLGEPEG